jgi:hypothetical protein
MRDRRERNPSIANAPVRALFICGSVNQTKQMHAVAAALPELEAHFTAYYTDGFLERMRRAGLCERTILGRRWRKDCLRYLRNHGLPMDHEGRRFASDYALVVTCSDVVMPRNILDKPIVLVQEGMTDPERFWYHTRRLLPFLPRWTAGTAWTGTSGLYDRFCVASEGYKELFVRKGAAAEKIVVTGIPNFDNCDRYRRNDFPLRDYVLVCTSDTRETFKPDRRERFLRKAVALAAGRPLVFKLHPNEDWKRSTREIALVAPEARVFTEGSAEEMVANCKVLVCQYSTLAFVGLALGKEVHSYFEQRSLQQLAPLQGGLAAQSIAAVCREVLREGVTDRSTGSQIAGSRALEAMS